MTQKEFKSPEHQASESLAKAAKAMRQLQPDKAIAYIESAKRSLKQAKRRQPPSQ